MENKYLKSLKRCYLYFFTVNYPKLTTLNFWKIQPAKVFFFFNNSFIFFFAYSSKHDTNILLTSQKNGTLLSCLYSKVIAIVMQSSIVEKSVLCKNISRGMTLGQPLSFLTRWWLSSTGWFPLRISYAVCDKMGGTRVLLRAFLLK